METTGQVWVVVIGRNGGVYGVYANQESAEAVAASKKGLLVEKWMVEKL